MSPWTKGMSFSAPWFAAASSSSVGSSMQFSSMGVSGSGWKSSRRLHSGSSLVSSGLSEKVISASLSVAVSAWLPLAESAFAASASSAYAFSGPNETGKAAALVFALPAASATTGEAQGQRKGPKRRRVRLRFPVLSAPARRPCSPAMRNRRRRCERRRGRIRTRPTLHRARTPRSRVRLRLRARPRGCRP